MKINIPEPCSEDWSKMTPTEKGAFCQKCAIDVVDFTDKSPFEIKNILKREMGSSGKACGRIRKSQLVEFNAFNFQPKSDRESFQFLWTFSLIAVFGLSLFSCQSTLSRELVEQINVSGTEFIEAKTSTPTSEEEELIEPIEISQDSVAHFINNEELKIEILSGAIAIEPEIECIIWSSIFVAGNMTLGVIMPEPETQEPIEWQSRGIITIPPEPISYTSPVYHHPREPTSNTPSDIIQTGNDREFDALIHLNKSVEVLYIPPPPLLLDFSHLGSRIN